MALSLRSGGDIDLEYKKMKKRSIIIGVLALALAIRFIRLNQPLSEFATRQVETAMVARNFYEHGFNLLYPEMDLLGQQGSFALEPGLVPFLAALLYKWRHGVEEYLGRLVSIIFWLGTTYVYYRWLSLFSRRIAIGGVVIFSFLPLSIIMSRTFQPDMAMLFFSILGLYYLTRYSLGEGNNKLWIGAGSMAVAVVLKITALSLLFPFMFLFFKKERRLGINFWLALFLIISPSLAWYSHAILLSHLHPSSLQKTWTLANWINPGLWFKAESWRIIFTNLWGATLTPLGFFLFGLGLFLKKEKSIESLFYYWLTGIALSLLVFFYHSQTHIYYWLPLTAVGAYFMASGLSALIEGRLGDRIYKNIFLRLILILLVGLTIFYYTYPAYRVPRAYGRVKEVAGAVKILIPGKSLVIASCSSGPYFLYYCHRRGWDFWINDPAADPIEYLEYLRKEGAEYFASANLKELNEDRKFRDYLYKTYRLIWEKEKSGVVFSLK